MKKRFKSILSGIGFSITFVSSAGFANRVLDYVPPPFRERLFCSLLTILPVVLLASIATYFIIKTRYKERCEKYRKIFFGTTCLFIIAASLLSANDGLNDEGWNPYMSGAHFSSLIIPLALTVLVNRLKLWTRIFFSIISIMPAWFLTSFLGMGWQFIGMKIGVPTTW